MQKLARIAKYELEEYLGGGMSEVYRARDVVLGRTVAIKLLTGQASMNEDTRARFLLEARVSSGINTALAIFGSQRQICACPHSVCASHAPVPTINREPLSLKVCAA